ncbi:hypothetical protein VNI00_015235 [Paramarasmius palmivorus]|uniref:Uncharacterized protein n=1 Tax=Paramarasmius palmivorus TaxID=297713 RepID=A0AAW0BM57_9AGAR
MISKAVVTRPQAYFATSNSGSDSATYNGTTVYNNYYCEDDNDPAHDGAKVKNVHIETYNHYQSDSLITVLIKWISRLSTSGKSVSDTPAETAVTLAVPSLGPSVDDPLLPSSVRYSRLLYQARLGTPLYHPGPPPRLSREYTKTGVQIGDVGIIRADMSFDFLFNITYPEDHPAHQRFGVPTGFVPISEESLEISEKVGQGKYSHVDGPRYTVHARRVPENELDCTSHERTYEFFSSENGGGAILTLLAWNGLV